MLPDSTSPRIVFYIFIHYVIFLLIYRIYCSSDDSVSYCDIVSFLRYVLNVISFTFYSLVSSANKIKAAVCVRSESDKPSQTINLYIKRWKCGSEEETRP